MKILLPLLFAAAALTPLHAASKAKSKNPALAETWIADAKTYEGKKVTTTVSAIGDFGQVSSDSEYAVVPVTTGSAAGDSGAEIQVLVPTAKLQGFVSSIEPKQAGKGGSFGGKAVYASLTATFATIQGERVLVVGDITPAAKAAKPSELLKAQLAATSEDAGDDKSKSDKKSDKKTDKKDKKKTVR